MTHYLSWLGKTILVVGHPSAFLALLIFLYVWQRTEQMPVWIAVVLATFLTAALVVRVLVLLKGRSKGQKVDQAMSEILSRFDQGPKVSPKTKFIGKFRP